jgi:putative FmdB family regulatory protein
MPLYEYRCRGCSHQFEILQRLGDGADGLACPRCQQAALDKQFSTFATSSGGAGAEAAACDSGACDAGACCGGGACGMEAWN